MELELKKNNLHNLSAITETEERFRIAQKMAFIGIWEYNIISKTCWASGECLKMFNLSADEGFIDSAILGNYINEINRIDETIHSLLTAGKKIETEYSIEKQGSSEKSTLHSITELIKDSNGNPVKIIGVLQDITDRKKYEDAVKRSEEKYSSLLEKMPAGFYKSTHDGKFVEVNPALIEILGYENKEELLSIDIKSQLYFAEDERESASLKETHKETAIFRLRKKNGSEIWVEDIGSYITGDGGEIIYHEGILLDVTKRLEVERALIKSEMILRESQKIAKIGSYSVDLVTGKWIGSTLLNELISVSDSDVQSFDDWKLMIHKDHLTHFSSYLSECIKSGKRFDYQYKIIGKNDGKERWIRQIGEYEYNGEDKLIRMFGTIQDCTESKNMELQLIQSQKLEGLGTLAGGIAHDFNNLMSMLLNNAELLKMNLETESKLNKYIDNIIGVSERGASISRQLLIFSRQSDIVLKPVSLSHVIDELMLMLKHFIPKTVAIETITLQENPMIYGDSGHIHQVLLNLCLNARDAMGETGTLTITEKYVDMSVVREKFNRDADCDYISVSVTDTGTGIEEELLNKIFNPFFTTKEKGKGTGLGLSIVDGLMKSHNGFIDVKTKLGHGTSFILYFPLTQKRVQSLPAAADQKGPLHGKNILLIDRNENICDLFNEYMSEIGVTVISATDSSKAMEKFSFNKNKIDLVVIDADLKDTSAENLLRRFKSIKSDLKAVFASNFITPDERELFLKSGAKDVIHKPYKFSELSKLFESIVLSN